MSESHYTIPQKDIPAPVIGLLVKRHSEKAKLPSRGSALAAGYDLYRCVISADTRVNRSNRIIVPRKKLYLPTARPL